MIFNKYYYLCENYARCHPIITQIPAPTRDMEVRRYILTVIALVMSLSLGAEGVRKEVCVHFRVNSTEIDTSYLNNAAQLERIYSIISDTTYHLVSLSFSGWASPEGPSELNKTLARERKDALRQFILSRVDVPLKLETSSELYIPWEELKAQVESRKDFSNAAKVLEVLNAVDLQKAQLSDDISEDIITKLRITDGGRAWQQLLLLYFPQMRNAGVVFYMEKPEEVEFDDNVSQDEPEPEVVAAQTLLPSEPAAKKFTHGLYLKTNALAWLGGCTNLAIEIDICPHLSLNIPFGYCAWDYFRDDLKFRTLFCQPELRCYIKPNDGFYIGAHFGVGSYNINWTKEYRIQDHNGTTPALGGGIGLGYRMPLSKKHPNWKVEFSLGAGAYSLYYDRFEGHHNGLLVDSKKKTYFGLDQASVSFQYRFDLSKKGGRK